VPPLQVIIRLFLPFADLFDPICTSRCAYLSRRNFRRKRTAPGINRQGQEGCALSNPHICLNRNCREHRRRPMKRSHVTTPIPHRSCGKSEQLETRAQRPKPVSGPAHELGASRRSRMLVVFALVITCGALLAVDSWRAAAAKTKALNNAEAALTGVELSPSQHPWPVWSAENASNR